MNDDYISLLLKQYEKHPQMQISCAMKSVGDHPFVQDLAQLFQRVDLLLQDSDLVLAAIDGNSGAGKSSLAALLQRVYDCNVYHMDDFFLPAAQKTAERLAEPGGNVHYERFRDEVLEKVVRGISFSYRPFNCSLQALGEEVTVLPKKFTIVEGAYSMHPDLVAVYDLTVFMEVDPEEQSRRILERNGQRMHERFIQEWIPLENKYFQAHRIKEQCAMILRG